MIDSKSKIIMCGLDPNDPTIRDVCDDGDLEKLSPRLMVDPGQLANE